jgi:hypothetical protein
VLGSNYLVDHVKLTCWCSKIEVDRFLFLRLDFIFVKGSARELLNPL